MSGDLTPEELALQESEAALAAEEAKREEVRQKATLDLAEVHAEEVAQAAAEVKEEPVVKAEPEEEVKAVVVDEVEEKERSREVNAIVALRKHAQLLAEQNAMLQGQVTALSKIASARPATPDAPQPKDRLEEIKAERKALAKQVDTGDLTVEEYEDKRAILEEESFEIRLERKQAAAPKREETQTEDLYLAEQTEKLASQYSFLKELTAEDMAPFKELAIRQAAKEGVRLYGASGTLELRKRMVELAAKVYQPEAVVKEAKPAETEVKPKDGKAAALEAKLKLQETMPPDVSKIGNGGDSTAIGEAEVARVLFDPNTTTEKAEALLASLSPALREKLSAG